MSKYREGDTAWIVEWIPRDRVVLDECSDHDPDQARDCEIHRVFMTREVAESFCRHLLATQADFFGCPAYGEYRRVASDDCGELPDGPRWELIGDLIVVSD